MQRCKRVKWTAQPGSTAALDGSDGAKNETDTRKRDKEEEEKETEKEMQKKRGFQRRVEGGSPPGCARVTLPCAHSAMQGGLVFVAAAVFASCS